MIRRNIGYVVTAVTSFAAGWLISASPHDTADATAQRVAPASTLARRAPLPDAPLIAVSTDGNVTLRVEQQPLEWVLEQIAQQSGWADVKQRAAAPAPAAASAPRRAAADTARVVSVQATPLLQAIERGGEVDRYSALLKVRAEGIAVSGQLLKSLSENDPSARVRTLAFELYLEPLIDSPEAMRTVLQLALQGRDEAIRAEAERRLRQLREGERVDNASSSRDDEE